MNIDFELDLSEKVNALPLSDDDKKRVIDIVFWAMEQVAPPKTDGVAPALSSREVELLREIRVNFNDLAKLNTDWRNEARNLLLRIEQAAAGVAPTEGTQR